MGAEGWDCLSGCVATRLWVDVLKIFTHGSWLAGRRLRGNLFACTEHWNLIFHPTRKSAHNNPAAIRFSSGTLAVHFSALDLRWKCAAGFTNPLWIYSYTWTQPCRGITRPKAFDGAFIMISNFPRMSSEQVGVCVCALGNAWGFLIRLFVGFTLHLGSRWSKSQRVIKWLLWILSAASW